MITLPPCKLSPARLYRVLYTLEAVHYQESRIYTSLMDFCSRQIVEYNFEVSCRNMGALKGLTFTTRLKNKTIRSPLSPSKGQDGRDLPFEHAFTQVHFETL